MKNVINPYYDLPQDTDPNDPNCGRTVKLISKVPVTEQLNLTGTSESSLKKRTLDVNSFITIEGFEGKPYQQNTSQQVINSDKGCGRAWEVFPGRSC